MTWPTYRLRPDRTLMRQLSSFVVIGIASTLAYAALYLLLRPVASAIVANLLALLITAVGNTAANRRLTFAVRGSDGLARDHLAGLLAFVIALGITTASVTALGSIAPGAGHIVELAVLIASNALATLARFVLLRAWIDRPRHLTPAPSGFERSTR